VIEEVTPLPAADMPTGPDLEPVPEPVAPHRTVPPPAPRATPLVAAATTTAATRRVPVAMIAGGIVVMTGLGVGAMLMLRGRGAPEPPAPPPPAAAAPTPVAPVVDSAAIRAADSAQAAAAAMGYVRIIGDLPDDVVIWLDTMRIQGRVAQVAAGRYTLEVETAEFKPWERRIMVRTGDTTRVLVELELLETDTPSP
jgi:hypothetical protein